MQQSLEEILRSRMAQPVSIKGKEGATVMPMEAIAMAIMNNAMKGDLAAANFIRQLTGTARDAQHDEAKARTRAGGWSRNRQTSQSTSRDIRKGASRFL